MKSVTNQRLQSQFDTLSLQVLGEDDEFQTVIKQAIESCEIIGYVPNNHFRGVTKMVKLNSAAERAVQDEGQ